MNETDANYVPRRALRLETLILCGLLVATALLPIACRNIPQPKFRPKQPNQNSPVVVRGGSMAAFAVLPHASGDWQAVNSGSSYCLNVDNTTNISSIVFTNEADASQNWPTPNTNLPQSIIPWEVDVYGHLYTYPKGNISSGDYWKIVSQAVGCPTPANPAPSGTSISVTGMGNAGFYPQAEMSPEGNYIGNIRFYDVTNGCQGVNANNDEEFCERLAAVAITLDTNVPNQTPYHAHCADGDCSLTIGSP
jgi:hypothetical protein